MEWGFKSSRVKGSDSLSKCRCSGAALRSMRMAVNKRVLDARASPTERGLLPTTYLARRKVRGGNVFTGISHSDYEGGSDQVVHSLGTSGQGSMVWGHQVTGPWSGGIKSRVHGLGGFRSGGLWSGECRASGSWCRGPGQGEDRWPMVLGAQVSGVKWFMVNEHGSGWSGGSWSREESGQEDQVVRGPGGQVQGGPLPTPARWNRNGRSWSVLPGNVIERLSCWWLGMEDINPCARIHHSFPAIDAIYTSRWVVELESKGRKAPFWAPVAPAKSQHHQNKTIFIPTCWLSWLAHLAMVF